MGLMSMFSRVKRDAQDTDFTDVPTEFCVYQPDADEFPEPHMDVPAVPVMTKRTSEQGSKQ